MNSFKSMIIGVVVLVSLAMFANCKKSWDHEKMVNHMVKHVSKKLDLDDSQKKQLDQIKEEFLAKQKGFKQEREEMHKAMIAEVKKDSIDKAKVKEISSKMDKQRNEVRDMMLDKLVDFHKTLNPEQKEKLVKLMEEFKERHSH